MREVRTPERTLALGRLLVRQGWLLWRANQLGSCETMQRGVELLEAVELDTRVERASALCELGSFHSWSIFRLFKKRQCRGCGHPSWSQLLLGGRGRARGQPGRSHQRRNCKPTLARRGHVCLITHSRSTSLPGYALGRPVQLRDTFLQGR